MPLMPEAVVAMQACARIGAIHSVVFGGFSALSLRDRIEDAGRDVVITADGGWRGGKIVELKAAADKALSPGVDASIGSVIVLKRTAQRRADEDGRDLWWHDVVEGPAAECEPAWVDAEHPLFLLYTSGSTGKPKGIQHSSAGYLLGAKLTTKWVFDLQRGRRLLVHGRRRLGHRPQLRGVRAAGRWRHRRAVRRRADYPGSGRFWKICESLGVTIFYTAPTAIRALMKLGDDIPGRYDLLDCGCSAASASRSIPKRGCGITAIGARALPDRRHLVADRNRRHHDFARCPASPPPSPAPARSRCPAST